LAGFKDISNGEWYTGVVGAAFEAGLISGYEDGTFRPNAYVKREEAAAIMVRALKFAGVKTDLGDSKTDRYLAKFVDEAAIDSWAKTAVALAVKHSVLRGYGSGEFAPAKTNTRAETAVMIIRMLEEADFI